MRAGAVLSGSPRWAGGREKPLPQEASRDSRDSLEGSPPPLVSATALNPFAP